MGSLSQNHAHTRLTETPTSQRQPLTPTPPKAEPKCARRYEPCPARAGTASFGRRGAGQFGYNKDTGYGITSRTSITYGSDWRNMDLSSSTSSTYSFDKSGRFTGSTTDTKLSGSYNETRAGERKRKEEAAKVASLREKGLTDDEIRTELEREAAQRRNEMNMMEKAGDMIAGAWLSMNNTLGQWGRDVAGMVSEFGESLGNWFTGDGYNTNREVAVNAAMKEYDRQTRRERDIAQSGALWESTDEFGNNLMNVYLYQKYAGDALAMENLGIDAGQAQKAFEDWDLASRGAIPAGGRYDENTELAKNRELNRIMGQSYSKDIKDMAPAKGIGRGFDLINKYMEGVDEFFLQDARQKAGQQSAITDVVIEKLKESLGSEDFAGRTPDEIREKVLNTKVPELLKSYGLDMDKKIKDYADKYSNYENYSHLENLINSYCDKPAALDDYYKNSSKYLFNIKTDFFRLDSYSPIKPHQYNALRELQRYRRQTQGLN